MNQNLQSILDAMGSGYEAVDTLIKDIREAPLRDIYKGIRLLNDALPLLNNPLMRAILPLEQQQQLEQHLNDLTMQETADLVQAFSHLVEAQHLLCAIHKSREARKP